MAKVYCPKCNLLVQQDDTVGAAALNCPKCGSSNLIPVVSKGGDLPADYNSSGIYRAAAEDEVKAKEQALQDYKSEGIYSTALRFFESLKDKPQESGAGPEPASLTENPFIVTTAQCPICENQSEQRSFKSHVFFTKDKDLDMRPTSYSWHNHSFEKLHPPLYYMWHCPRCHYTSSQAAFKTPEANSSLNHKRMVERVMAVLYAPANAPVIHELTDGLNPAKLDFPMALKSHLLAIFLMERVDEIRERDCLVLGQYLMRLAWLFRDLPDFPAERPAVLKQYEELSLKLAPHWPTLPINETAAMKMAADHYDRAYERSPVVSGKNIGHIILGLIARIYAQMDDFEAADRVVPLSISEAENYRRQLTRAYSALSNGKKQASEQLTKKLKQEIVKIDYFLSEVGKLSSIVRLRLAKKR